MAARRMAGRMLLAALMLAGARGAVAGGPGVSQGELGHLWRVLGVSPDGTTLATLAVQLSPPRGYHRYRFVQLDRTDGSVRHQEPLLPAERHALLAKRGDFDLLVYERRQARAELLDALREDGYSSCRPARLAELEINRPQDIQDGADEISLTVRAEWSHMTALLTVRGEPGAQCLELNRDDAPHEQVFCVPLDLGRHETDPLVTHRYKIARIYDAFHCGPGPKVILLESARPLHPEIPVKQIIVTP